MIKYLINSGINPNDDIIHDILHLPLEFSTKNEQDVNRYIQKKIIPVLKFYMDFGINPNGLFGLNREFIQIQGLLITNLNLTEIFQILIKYGFKFDYFQDMSIERYGSYDYFNLNNWWYIIWQDRSILINNLTLIYQYYITEIIIKKPKFMQDIEEIKKKFKIKSSIKLLIKKIILQPDKKTDIAIQFTTKVWHLRLYFQYLYELKLFPTISGDIVDIITSYLL
jgi:hypothetical protein